MALDEGDGTATVCWFDSEGRYLGGEGITTGAPELQDFLCERYACREGAILVRPFEDRAVGVGAQPLPHWLLPFVLGRESWRPDALAGDAAGVQEWMTLDDTYVLEICGNTFYI